MTALSHASVPPPHALDEDFRLLKLAVEEAGKLAHSYFRQEVAVRRKKDGTEVSDADIAVNEALKEALLGGRPDYGWLSEESEDDATRLERRLVWMVDPIDGTNAFLRHIPEWTISAALVQEGKPVAGAVFNPATGEFFHAIRGRGAFLNGTQIKVTGRETLEGALFVIRFVGPHAPQSHLGAAMGARRFNRLDQSMLAIDRTRWAAKRKPRHGFAWGADRDGAYTAIWQRI